MAGEWFEQESFWAEFYPVLFPESRFQSAPAEADLILALTQNHRCAVLDLCCGPGRHSLAFASRGCRVTGVDRTGFLLAEARQRAAKVEVEVEFVQQDMRSFVRRASFDLAVNLYSSLGYFEDAGQDLVVLKNIHASLRPGGMVVIDGIGKEPLARTFQPSMVSPGADGSLYILRSEITDDWSRVRSEWIHIDGDRATRIQISQIIYSGQELKSLMGRAGFVDVKLYGSLKGNPYGFQAQRLVAVARKG